jgi:hypothetical protein
MLAVFEFFAGISYWICIGQSDLIEYQNSNLPQ